MICSRGEAQGLGLKVKGTIGIIVDAYRRQLMTLPEVEIIFKAISERDDIWLSEAVIAQVWQELQKS